MWLGITLGEIGYHLLRRHRGIGMRNLEIAFPEKSDAERAAILKGSFRNLGRTLAVFSKFDDLTEEKIRRLVHYDPDPDWRDRSYAVRAAGRGHIIVGAHIGNWELAAFSTAVLFAPLPFVARRMDSRFIEDRAARMRTRLGNTQIDKTDSVTEVLDLLRDGGTVCVLADVNSQHHSGVFVPFFGKAACTHSSVAMMAMRTNSVILPMWTVWDEENKRYKVEYDELIEPVRTGRPKDDIVNNTERFVAATERIIRRYPEQWIWLHRRWKTRPDGDDEPVY